MMTQNLLSLFTCSSLLILSLFYSSQTCNADNSYRTPSSCGVIRNISFPFCLKDDPKNCGDRRFELACENNVTSLYLNSQKYYVKSINYSRNTIGLADASIQNDDICSFPTVSAYSDNINFSDYPYTTHPIPPPTYPYDEVNLPIHLVTCPKPLKNSYSRFTNVTKCGSSSSNSSSHRFHYIMVDRMLASELPEMCELVIVLTSWSKFKDIYDSVSLSEIHQSLLYGFELEFCTQCRTSSDSNWVEFRNVFVSRLTSPLLILPAILVLFCAAVGPPVMAIIGLTAVVGLLTFIAHQLYFRIKFSDLGGFDPLDTGLGLSPLTSGFVSSIIIVCASRIVIYPFILLLLIYKFRRRHLSVYEEIEGFLQSDNKLAPIRYSYSDIKKMTRGFRQKLGEGGFGSVYKGKLRSGHHVAVKLLRKSGASGQDFMNEIATIGRIHHVNVVQLVGYCFERSKCALIFDFMPNGSLEKYIFNREKTYSLDWDKKFEIAVGVARGIQYLHRGCDIQILHFDIKPHNILLDDKFVPKVSDFGLAKLCSIEKDYVTMTCARGTIGYVAPELINRSIGAVSHKADVYSFGMLLMEMVGLNRELKGNNDESSKYFPCWIYDRLNQGMDFDTEIEMTEESNGHEENEVRKKSFVRKMTIVGLWCIQMNPNDRPSMNKVLQMLEGDVARLQIPAYPSHSAAHAAVNVEESWVTSGSDSVSLLHNENGSSIDIITIA